MTPKNTLNLGQLKLLPTNHVDEIFMHLESLIALDKAYHKRPSVRASIKLRKTLLLIQKAAISARAEILSRRKVKTAAAAAGPYTEPDVVYSDPSQTALPL